MSEWQEPVVIVPTEAEVVAVIARVLRDEVGTRAEVTPSTDLQRDLALDSLGAFTLVVELEDRFLVTLPEAAASEVRTVGDLALLVVRRAEAESLRQQGASR